MKPIFSFKSQEIYPFLKASLDLSVIDEIYLEYHKLKINGRDWVIKISSNRPGITSKGEKLRLQFPGENYSQALRQIQLYQRFAKEGLFHPDSIFFPCQGDEGMITIFSMMPYLEKASISDQLRMFQKVWSFEGRYDMCLFDEVMHSSNIGTDGKDVFTFDLHLIETPPDSGSWNFNIPEKTLDRLLAVPLKPYQPPSPLIEKIKSWF